MCEGGRRAGPRPRWGTLYALAAVTALAVGAADAWTTSRALDAAVVVAGFAAMGGWLRRNRAALDQQRWCACAGDTLTVRVVASRRPDSLPADPPPVRKAARQPARSATLPL